MKRGNQPPCTIEMWDRRGQSSILETSGPLKSNVIRPPITLSITTYLHTHKLYFFPPSFLSSPLLCARLVSNVLIFTKALIPNSNVYDPSYHIWQCLSRSVLVGGILSSCIKDFVIRERVCILCSLRSSRALLSMLLTLNPIYVICFLSGKAEQKETPSLPSKSC